MKHHKHILTSFILILTLLLTGFTSRAVQAENPDEYEFSGIVETVSEDGFSFLTEEDILISVSAIEEDEGNFFFTLTVGDEDPLTISVDEEFDFGVIEEGGEFELEVKFNEEDEEWSVYKHKFEEKEQEREREEDGYFCSEDSEEQHPVALAIAKSYDTDYESVIGMFCDGQGEEGSARTGFGQIMLAYQTAGETEGSAEDILTQRLEGKGWGQIWQDMDLIGKPDDVGPPEGKGKPESAGPPEDAGPPENVGAPEEAGPPEHAGPKH